MRQLPNCDVPATAHRLCQCMHVPVCVCTCTCSLCPCVCDRDRYVLFCVQAVPGVTSSSASLRQNKLKLLGYWRFHGRNTTFAKCPRRDALYRHTNINALSLHFTQRPAHRLRVFLPSTGPHAAVLIDVAPCERATQPEPPGAICSVGQRRVLKPPASEPRLCY